MVDKFFSTSEEILFEMAFPEAVFVCAIWALRTFISEDIFQTKMSTVKETIKAIDGMAADILFIVFSKK